MRPIGRMRFSLRTLLMLVLAVGSLSALFGELYRHGNGLDPAWQFDLSALLVLGIVLTALSLGAIKGHTPGQVLLQIALACGGCLAVLRLDETGPERAIRYAVPALFAATVTAPLLVRRYVKAALPRGPRRDRAKATCEAVIFSFLNPTLVLTGVLVLGFLSDEGLPFFLPGLTARSVRSIRVPLLLPPIPPAATPPAPTPDDAGRSPGSGDGAKP